MADKRKCPKCGSTDISRDLANLAGNTIKETIGGTLGLVIGLPVGLLMGDIGLPRGKGTAEKIAGIVHDGLVGGKITKRYKCNRCGRSFQVTESSTWSNKQ